MEITSAKVKELREKTGAGMMDCKNALVEAEGNEEKAIELLRKKGLSRVEKRSGREAKEGLVQSHIRPDGRLGVLVEVNSETDFVARTDDFRNIVSLITEKIASAPKIPVSVDEVLDMQANGSTIRIALNEVASKLGENLIFRRFCRLEVPTGMEGYIDTYIHTGSKLGVLLFLEATSSVAAAHPEFRTLAREIALHIAAANPLAVSREDISQETIEKEKEIYKAQLEAEGKKKPPEVIEKILNGKMNKFFAEVCLIEQSNVKYPDKTVGDLIKETAAKLGGNIVLKQFCRFKVGE